MWTTLLNYLRMLKKKLPEDVWDQRNSRKESVMVAAIICQKSGLSLQRRVVQPRTQLLGLIETH